MSVYQNINGTFVRQDAAAISQLAAVDTEDILGGGAGATTDGQTLVDQLAADDVQAQTDIGQIKTDLSDKLDIADEQVLGAWNLLPSDNYSQTINDVAFTRNSDGSITANGTASDRTFFQIHPAGEAYSRKNYDLYAGRYISGCSGGGASKYGLYITYSDDGTTWAGDTSNYDGFTLVSTEHLYIGGMFIVIESGVTVNTKFRPMISLKPNMPYVPYAPTNRECMSYAVNGEVGAHNLLNNVGTTQTINDVTFTVNADKSVTVNGTASAQADFYVGTTSNLALSRLYKLTGCPSGGASTSYHILVKRFASGNPYDAGNGLEFSLASGDTYHDVYIRVQQGTAVNNLVFKPMIRVAEDTDETYRQFTMTNRELTASALTLEAGANISITRQACYTFSGIGLAVIVNISATSAVAIGSTVLSLPSGYAFDGAQDILAVHQDSSVARIHCVDNQRTMVLRGNNGLTTGQYIHINGVARIKKS